MKKIVVLLLLGIFLLSLSAYAGKKVHVLKPGGKIVTAEQMEEGLSGTDLQERISFFKRFAWTLKDENYFKNDVTIKAKVIELLKAIHKFREDQISESVKQGLSLSDAETEFETKFRATHEGRKFRDWADYVTFVVWDFDEPETIPLIIKTNVSYSSDGFTMDRYLQHFGKKALKYFLGIARNGAEKEKVGAYGCLNSWMTLTIVKNNGVATSWAPLRQEHVLNPDEIEEVKKLFLDGIKSDNAKLVQGVIWGLENIARYSKDDVEKKEIKELLKQKLNYPDIYIRKDLAGFLGEIGDAADLADLKEMLNDSGVYPASKYSRKNKAGAESVSDLSEVYPVREAARKAIERIEKREATKKDGR